MRWVIVVLLAVGAVIGPAEAAPAEKIRRCANIEGMFGWFPGDRKTLQTDVDKYLADAGEVKVEGEPVAVIAPHAGYRWSGPTAAYAFKPLKGRKYGRVIVMGPSHHVGFWGGSIADVDCYETPLGRVPLDKPACKGLLARGICRSDARAHTQEHSLQNELPFLQTVLKDWQLVPIVVGAGQNETAVEQLAEAVKTVVGPDTLIVISSDFTHFGPRFSYTPFRTDLKRRIRELDQGAIDRICAVDCKGFSDYMRRTRTTICGRDAIAVMLKVFEGRKDVRGKLVHYASSGEMSGDYRNSVSYASIVLSRVEEPQAELDVKVITDEGAGGKKEVPEKLTEVEQKLCLTMARAQLQTAVKDRQMIKVKQYGWDLTPKLLSQGAVFVTLKNHGRLRGCIGDVVAHQPLYLSVIRNAANAALRDYRFRNNPITEKELGDIDVEISYLTPQKKIESYTDIDVARHGVLLEKDGRRAVFLPQVATEQGWDRETLLRHLCLKARLPEDAYRTGCTFHVFEAQVFGEREYGMVKK